jgi:Rps23 Pro-64 3,4-dihydroxylase Tpa1-like proline 4-hydroxylase
MSFTYKSVSNLLTKEECDLILKFSLENLILNPATIVGYDSPNHDTRKSNVVFYPYYKKFPFILEKISKLLDENITIKGFDLDYKNSEFQFTEYKDGDFFAWHKDITGNEITQHKRYCSLVIQLNDEYDGGDLELKLSDDSIMKVEKGIGNIIVFLSDIKHRVTGVKSGNRYTLVNWVGIKEINNYKKTLL